MSNKDIEKRHHQTFENIKQQGNDGSEFWLARQLGKILDYAEYRNFLPVIEKAKKACVNSGQPVENHFVEMHEMVPIGSGAERKNVTGYYLLQKGEFAYNRSSAKGCSPVIPADEFELFIQKQQEGYA